MSALPKPAGPYCDASALELLMQYRKDPASLTCPEGCTTGEQGRSTMEVLAFIEPGVDLDGFATAAQPVGDYAAALMCHACRRAVGILGGIV